VITISKLLRKLNTASRLSFARLGLFFESWIALAIVKLRLMTAPIPLVRRSMMGSDPPLPPRPGASKDLLAGYELALRNHLWRFNCLPRSLALQLLLRRRGIDARLRIGARRVDSRLDGHAWIEVDGLPINENADVAEVFPPLRANPEDVVHWVG